MQPLRRGLLIAIEGIDGSGKSTLARHLYQMLASDYKTMLTKEPGGTPLGQSLRALLQEPSAPLAPKCEYLLFAADRAQHFYELIIPALAECTLIISDRMSDSSLVYQAYAKQLDTQMIQSINAWVMEQRKPDLVIYVRISAAQAYERMQQRGSLTGMEKNQLHLMQTFVDGFEKLYQSDTHTNAHIYPVDGTCAQDTLAQQTYEYIKQWITHQQTV
jgi:dTMP kinase